MGLGTTDIAAAGKVRDPQEYAPFSM